MGLQFIMVKPKAVDLGLTETFFNEFVKNGLVIIWQRRLRLSAPHVEFLYSHQRNQAWFEEFVKVMTSGDVIISLWKGEGITEIAMKIRNKLRQDYKHLTEYYTIHVADSEREAEKQLEFLLGEDFYQKMNQPQAGGDRND